MSSSFYVGPQVRPIRLDTFDEVVQAAAQGNLDENQWVELKEMFREGKAVNLEIAKDMASLAVDGGLLLVGIRDDKGKAGEVVGTVLEGLTDRLAQVAVARIDPPLNITTRVVPHPDDPTRGVVIVVVPASLAAPHMVDGAYWARSATGKRTMSDPEVRRWHAEQAGRRASFETMLRNAATTLNVVPTGIRQHAHTHIVFRPTTPPHRSVSQAFAETGQTFLNVVNEGIRFTTKYMPTILGAQQSVPHPDGWELTTGATDESYALRLLLGDDGSLTVVSGATSQKRGGDDSREYISLGSVTELVHSTAQLAGHVASTLLAYQGTWQAGVYIDGVKGHFSTLAMSVYSTRFSPYPKDEYLKTAEVTTAALQQDHHAVVVELLLWFTRGLGAEKVLDYTDPARIGDNLR